MLHAVPIQYFLKFVVPNGICLSGTSLRLGLYNENVFLFLCCLECRYCEYRPPWGGVADVDRLLVASVLTYDFICHDV